MIKFFRFRLVPACDKCMIAMTYAQANDQQTAFEYISR